MAITFDHAKDAANVRKHGLSLATFTGFDRPPLVVVDDRRDYGEARYRAFGRIDGNGHCLVYIVAGENMRAISFRRAHEEEMRRYEQTSANR